MSFKPFGFTYTPPATVPTPAPASTIVVSPTPNVGVGGPTSGVNSRAGGIIALLNDLTEMSQYLQDAIVSLTGNTAIEINPAVDPVTARSLAGIYGTDSPPSSITVAMYDHILDAHFGALQEEMAVGNNSTIQPNPMQVADLMQAVSAVNNGLVNSPSFNNYLPLQLASLKGDSIVFQSMAQAISTYPAYYSTQPLAPTTLPAATIIPASTLDVNPDLAAYCTDALNRFAQVYTATYQSMASPSPAAQAAGAIMSLFFTQPLSTMVRISALLGSLASLATAPAMATAIGDPVNYTFARLASDTASMMVDVDQLVSLTQQPLTGSATASLTNLLTGAAAQQQSAGTVSSGALAGMSKANFSAASNPANKSVSSPPLSTPDLGTVSEGLKQTAETINWAQTSMTGNLTLLSMSFKQLTERRLNNANDTQSLMSNTQTLDTVSGLASGTVSELQKGTLTANSSPQAQQEAASRILTSLQTGSNTTFTTTGNQIIVNPPSLPPVTAPVQRVLAIGGVKSTAGAIQS